MQAYGWGPPQSLRVFYPSNCSLFLPLIPFLLQPFINVLVTTVPELAIHRYRSQSIAQKQEFFINDPINQYLNLSKHSREVAWTRPTRNPQARAVVSGPARSILGPARWSMDMQTCGCGPRGSPLRVSPLKLLPRPERWFCQNDCYSYRNRHWHKFFNN